MIVVPICGPVEARDVGHLLTRASADKEETLVAEIEPIIAVRKGTIIKPGAYEIDLLAHRRPDAYGRLIRPLFDHRNDSKQLFACRLSA